MRLAGKQNKLREMKDFIAYPDELTNEALGRLNK